MQKWVLILFETKSSGQLSNINKFTNMQTTIIMRHDCKQFIDRRIGVILKLKKKKMYVGLIFLISSEKMLYVTNVLDIT